MASLTTAALALCGSLAAAFADPVATKPEEMADMRAWFAAHLGMPAASAPSGLAAAEIPFSFTFVGRPFAEVCKDWETTCDARKLDDGRSREIELDLHEELLRRIESTILVNLDMGVRQTTLTTQ